jgi:PAP2 superfamily
MKPIKLLALLFLFSIVIITESCQPDDENTNQIAGKKSNEFDASILNAWYGHTLRLIPATSGYTPPVVSRNLGYIGLTAYETTTAGSIYYRSLVGQLNAFSSVPSVVGGEEYYMPAAVNAAMAKIHTYLFPLPEAKKSLHDSIAIIKNFYDSKFLAEGVKQNVLDRSNAYGEAMADAIYEYQKTDFIGHEGFRKNFPASYAVPKGEGFWEPTSAQQIPLQPFWGSVRTFVPNSITIAQPQAPPLFSKSVNSDFYNYALEVFNQVKNNTPEQKKIALYWADGGGTITPPGHSIAITKQLVEENNMTLDAAAETYCKVGIAVTDAFICCWKCKYSYNLMRPVTFIQKNIDPAWKPAIATPPFPEYTSGHSSQAGAAGYVLSKIFGATTPFTDKTHAARKDIDGTPRKYDNFMQMAEEAAASRLYGGIHYKFGNDNGNISGIKIGRIVDGLTFKK